MVACSLHPDSGLAPGACLISSQNAPHSCMHRASTGAQHGPPSLRRRRPAWHPCLRVHRLPGRRRSQQIIPSDSSVAASGTAASMHPLCNLGAPRRAPGDVCKEAHLCCLHQQKPGNSPQPTPRGREDQTELRCHPKRRADRATCGHLTPPLCHLAPSLCHVTSAASPAEETLNTQNHVTSGRHAGL